MENKPQNVFEKLDKQEGKIEDISSKLEGISINNLYALAKRTWDYGDFQTAQKYYNYISLLNPLDWEAPLYASLCNFRGYHNMFFWTKVPEQAEKIIVSTFEYINNLDLNNFKKNLEMQKYSEIVKDEMIRTKDHYFKYKEQYDNENSGYIYILQNYYLNIINKVKVIELSSTNALTSSLAEELLDLIKKVGKVSTNISKDIFDELNNRSPKKFDFNFNEIYKVKKEGLNAQDNELSNEEIKEIMLKGKLFFEYNDKVISKRLFNKKLIDGFILIALSVIGIIFSLLSNGLYSLLFALPALYGIYLVIAAITTKDKINCSSIFCSKREKNRLTSNGNVITEQKKNIFLIIFCIGSRILFVCIFIFVLMILKQSKIENLHRVVILISGVLSIFIYYLSFIRFTNEHHSKYSGKYTYVYKGKNYNLD